MQLGKTFENNGSVGIFGYAPITRNGVQTEIWGKNMLQQVGYNLPAAKALIPGNVTRHLANNGLAQNTKLGGSPAFPGARGSWR